MIVVPMLNLIYHVLIVIGTLVVVLLGFFVYDRRFKHDQGTDVPQGYIRTEETNIDPATGEFQRVYYNPQTGDRYYRKEKSD